MDQFMVAALNEARTGAAEGGIPIGAALFDGQGRLVATGRNRRVQDKAVVMHAEHQLPVGRGQDRLRLPRDDHLLHPDALQHVRRCHRPVRNHDGDRRGIEKLPRQERSGSAAEARSRGRRPGPRRCEGTPEGVHPAQPRAVVQRHRQVILTGVNSPQTAPRNG